MEMKVIGIGRSNRTSKTTGREYTAVNVYCTYGMNGIDGLACEAVFCTSAAVPDGIKVGDRVRVLYNKFGHVEKVEIVA
jgi:hypothetical protein